MKTSKEHQHGPGCGHIAVEHRGHTDYIARGHLQHQEANRVAEHTVEIDAEHPDRCTGNRDTAGHRKEHVHGLNCGHEAVPHGNHTDYLVDGHLHHPHGDHCDDHGVHQIICMVSVRDRFVPTVQAVDMLLAMACCVTVAGAPVRVFGIYFD